MIEIIKQWAEKDFYIGFYSVYENGKLQWTGNVRYGKTAKFHLPEGDKKNGYRIGSYATIEEAINACVELCKNFVPEPPVVYKPPTVRKTKKKK